MADQRNELTDKRYQGTELVKKHTDKGVEFLSRFETAAKSTCVRLQPARYPLAAAIGGPASEIVSGAIKFSGGALRRGKGSMEDRTKFGIDRGEKWARRGSALSH
ncbi:hypothetical protein [Microbulbifer donghaiensis]|uniref:hypothetical protein n=1 Tax=Microbulbifer donghaiensis TaxID=494016 RepID=UPI001161455E|nr:hypothetical protein [Microbulbifer donghaiensis]